MYAIVDIETTGGYAANHKMTEIAVYHHDGIQITASFHTLINPGRRVPYFITGLTGITNEMVSQAPSFQEVAGEIHGWLKDKIFVAHNVHFDYSFVKKELEEAGITWASKRLCTVRLARKIIPGLDSYSLGRMAESLGVVIQDRHRAAGDAEATARIFDLLLKRDQAGVIAKALKRNSGEMILPPNLPREEFDRLPSLPGVYYFLDARGTIIYVGKANNIRRRMVGHFTGEAREWNRSNIRNEIHHIQFELTGNELIALIHEAQEIRKWWPRYNLAQKNRYEEWGIFEYEDRQGYRRLAINLCTRGTTPLLTFSNKGEAWSFLWNRANEYHLCPKLAGLQLAKGPCLAHQSGTCDGACEGKEDPESYNQRVAQALAEEVSGETQLIVGAGRNEGERSIVLLEDGVYAGHGFCEATKLPATLEEARSCVKAGKEVRFTQTLINSFLKDPVGCDIIPLVPQSVNPTL